MSAPPERESLLPPDGWQPLLPRESRGHEDCAICTITGLQRRLGVLETALRIIADNGYGWESIKALEALGHNDSAPEDNAGMAGGES